MGTCSLVCLQISSYNRLAFASLPCLSTQQARERAPRSWSAIGDAGGRNRSSSSPRKCGTSRGSYSPMRRRWLWYFLNGVRLSQTSQMLILASRNASLALSGQTIYELSKTFLSFEPNASVRAQNLLRYLKQYVGCGDSRRPRQHGSYARKSAS